ncbi:SdpI family protein [Mucilaginibacter antarcticus]|uniref:SdpI family protein n=1 Tax=Mucilaginibacter antarcticus TaxID=1855725 RepID=A0ABW5XL74_9SPHI
MRMEQWIIGPQLTGIILLILGLVMSRFPPKQINGYYGYRMPSFMKNQQTWDEANRYSATYMVKAGLVTTIIGIVIAGLLATMQTTDDIRAGLSIGSMTVSGLLPAVFVIVATEKHLTKIFGDR